MNNELKVSMAELCLSLGLKLSKLASANEDGTCSCRNIKCKHIGKHPIAEGWQSDLISNKEDLLEFLKRRPNSNLAIYTAASDTFFALDFDAKNGGLETLKKMEQEFGPLPPTPTVLTGGGGYHFYFSINKELKGLLRGKLTKFPGLDIISNGNLVIPGSLHKSGNLYRFKECHSPADLPLAELPQSWLEAISNKPKAAAKRTMSPNLFPEGTRNSSLFAEACKYFSRGLGVYSVNQAISVLNLTSCQPPLEESEVAQIIESAQRHTEAQISCYAFQDGNTVYFPAGANEPPLVIANFQARLSEQKKIIDGSDDPPAVIYGIEFLHPRLVPNVYEISPEELEECSFPARIDGALVLYSINKNKAHLRLALRQLGDVNNRKLIHIMTGWVDHDGKKLFLTNSGCLGVDGLGNQLRTHEECGGPKDYSIKLTNSEDELRSIHQNVIKLLKVSAPEVTIPLFAATFRAPLAHFLPLDFCLAIIGATGSMKSTIAGLFMSFYGQRFNYNNLPGSFTSTANALERQTFLVKDCLLVIDDWVQGEHSIQFAERVIRSHGNRAGRARMNKDTTLKTVYFPRCLTIITAEDLQVGQSARARLVILNSNGGSVDKKLLTELQKIGAKGDFSEFLGSYIQWIALNWNSISENIHSEFEKYRDFFRKKAKHNRTAPNLAHLMIGLLNYSRFCVDKNLFSQDEADSFISECTQTLADITEIQNENQAISDPVEIFLMSLQGAIEAGRAHIILPINADRSLSRFMGYRDPSSVHVGTPMGECIGQVNGGQLIIKPDICLGIVKRYADEKRMKLHLSSEAMGKQLRDRGLLITDDNRTTSKRTVNGRRERCWVFDNWIQVLNPDFESSAPMAPSAPLQKVFPVVNEGNKTGDKDSNGTASNKNLH